MQVQHPSNELAATMLSTIKEFTQIPRSDLFELVAITHWRHYLAKETVLHWNETSNNIFFIISGAIRVTYYAKSGKEVILCDLSRGSMFGELTAIDGQARSATVIAKEDCLLANAPGNEFMNLIFSNKYLSIAMLKRLTAQVRRLTQRVFDFSTLAVKNRVRAELIRLAENIEIGVNKAIISPAPTHIDLANLISTHREAVTRELNYLEKNKLIKREENDLIILDVARLSHMIDNDEVSLTKECFA